MVVNAASVDTANDARDNEIRSDKFFDAVGHPQITFRSSDFRSTGSGNYHCEGELTLRGQTRPAVMDVTFYGGAFNPLTRRVTIGFAGDLVIDRTEFGVGNLPEAIVGHEVRIHIEAEFQREGETDE